MTNLNKLYLERQVIELSKIEFVWNMQNQTPYTNYITKGLSILDAEHISQFNEKFIPFQKKWGIKLAHLAHRSAWIPSRYLPKTSPGKRFFHQSGPATPDNSSMISSLRLFSIL